MEHRWNFFKRESATVLKVTLLDRIRNMETEVKDDDNSQGSGEKWPF